MEGKKRKIHPVGKLFVLHTIFIMKFTLHYFGIAARAEHIRLAFVVQKVKSSKNCILYIQSIVQCRIEMNHGLNSHILIHLLLSFFII